MNLLKNSENYGKVRKGWLKAATPWQEKPILRVASNFHLTARQIVEGAGVKTRISVKHREAGIKFAESHIKCKKRKKCYLDGPAGWSYYYLGRRQHEGRYVMIWAGISYRRKTEIKFVSSNTNSQNYLKLTRNKVVNRG